MRYIILNDDKTPSEKLSDGGHPRAEVEDFANLAVLVPKPFIVLDFDTNRDAELALKVVNELDIKCLAMKTTRGIHLWFKNPEPMKNSIKTKCAIGLHYDVRSWGKLSYTVVKRDGKWREWLKTVPADEIQELPIWLKPVSSKYRFKDMTDGDGRNQSLFEYILTLQSKGFTRDQVKKTINIINSYVLKEPLLDNELEVVLRDESFVDESEIEETVALGECFDEDGGFKHNKFAELLVDRMDIVTVNENCYVYDDGIYRPAERRIDQETIQLYKRSRKSQRAEVLDYIKILTYKEASSIKRDEYIINLLNGRLDVRTNELLEWDPKYLDFTQLPVKYDLLASCDLLDHTINKVFQGDKEVIDLFDEMVGYTLIKNARYRKGFLFYGGGSNGKSTILNLLKKFIGEDNLSTVELSKLSDPFLTAELENKLANIGDDIDAKEIIDTGTIKKLFSGESLTVQRKYKDPFTMRNFAKMIFSCNQLPRILDKTQGMYSRLILVPFTAEFKSTDKDFDPFIEEKITTPEALSHLLNRALRGLNRLLSNNRFTEPQLALDALINYQKINSTALTWVDEDYIEIEELLSKPTNILYSDFSDWCTLNGIKNVPTIRTFHKDVEEHFFLERKRARNEETGGKYSYYFIKQKPEEGCINIRRNV